MTCLGLRCQTLMLKLIGIAWRAIAGCLPTIANASDDAAYDCPFGTIGQEMIPERERFSPFYGHIYLLLRSR